MDPKSAAASAQATCVLLLAVTSTSVEMGKKRAHGKPGRARKRVFRGNQFVRSAEVCSDSHGSSSSDSEGAADVSDSLGLRTVKKLVLHSSECSDRDLADGSDTLVESSSDDSSEEDFEDDCAEEASSGCRLVDLQQLQLLLSSAASCRSCGEGDLLLAEVKREGLAPTIGLTCTNCEQRNTRTLANKRGRFWDVNRCAVLGMKWIGRGRQALVKLCAALNMPSPMAHSTFDEHVIALRKTTVTVAERSMAAAADEVHKLSDAATDAVVDTTVTFDGTWMRRGHTSLHGVFSVISWDVGKVLDYQIASKYCQQCAVWTSRRNQGKVTEAEYQQFVDRHECTRTTLVSSGGMEAEAAPILWERSEATRRLRYTTFIGDGDSKGFAAVRQASPYGPDVDITKEECVGHVQKRIGTNLRNLKKDLGKKKLEDGKTIGGRGRLTDRVIDKLQAYYGMAVRAHSGDLQAMCRAIWASVMHRVSTDAKPQHQYCPQGIESWCKWQQQQAGGDVYMHHDSIPAAVFDVIKPLYIRLTDKGLLQRCLRGATQNQNECWNGIIWQLCPKVSFSGAGTVDMAAAFATIWFNDGAVAVQRILEEMAIPAGTFTLAALRRMDGSRSYHAKRKATEAEKSSRKRRRRVRKGVEDAELQVEGVQYQAGQF